MTNKLCRVSSRRVGRVLACAASMLAIGGTTPAWANTDLFVSPSGADAGTCQSAATPCHTFGYAITQERLVPDVVTIHAAAGTYIEDLALNGLDSGLSIAGAGSATDPAANTIIRGVVNATPAIATTTMSSLALSHLRVLTDSTDGNDAIGGSTTAVALTDVAIDVGGSGSAVSDANVATTGGSITLSNTSAAGFGVLAAGQLTLTDTPIVVNGNGHGAANTPGGETTLLRSPVTLTNPTGSGAGVYSPGGKITVDSSPVDVKGTGYGIYGSAAPVSLTNSPVTLENTSGGGNGVYGPGGPIALTGSAVDIKGTGHGIYGSAAAVSLTNSPVTLENTSGGGTAILNPGGAVTADGSPIEVRGTGNAVNVNGAPLTLRDLAITMTNPTSATGAIQSAASRVSLTRVTISGGWRGSALQASGSTVIADSSLSSGSTPVLPLLLLNDAGPYGHDLSILRTTLKVTDAAPTPQRVIAASNVNVLLDSSLVLGGAGTLLAASSAAARTATVAGSTLDSGVLGVRDAQPSVTAASDNTAGTVARVNVLGSVLVEAPTSTRASSGTAAVNCTSTEVPGTSQAQTATLGTISCATGTRANTSTSSLAAIFAAPGTDYAPNPSFSGVDSVPESVFSLPAGATPSSTDLRGNARVLNGVGTCLAGTRDKGAIELAGRGGVTPAPAITGPATVLAGSAATFSGSATTTPGAALTWSSSDGATGTGADFTHAFATSGTATVTLTATGAAGCAAATTAVVTVSNPGPGPAAGAGLASLTKLKLTPTAFFAAPSGRTVVAAKAKTKRTYGTLVTYNDSSAAKSSFTVSYKITGRRKGKSCVKKTKANAKAKRCKLTVSVGTFTHTDKAGANRLRFSGRLNGRKLAKRTYSLTAVAKTSAGAGPAVSKTFRVKG